nr:MAG TPA: hypothetical protein [Crassvirales sp.]
MVSYQKIHLLQHCNTIHSLQLLLYLYTSNFQSHRNQHLLLSLYYLQLSFRLRY